MKTKDTIQLAELINQRQWYEKPGRQDRYSDGSPCYGPIPEMDDGAASNCLHISDVLSGRVRKVPWNPAAGAIRKKDLQGQWMKRPLTLQDADNRKAAILVQQKKEVNLAKQSIAGLKTLNVNYDMTELSIILRLGFRYADRRTCEQAQKPEVQRALAVLDAALKFDVKKIAAALNLPVKRAKTFGYVNTTEPQQQQQQQQQQPGGEQKPTARVVGGMTARV